MRLPSWLVWPRRFSFVHGQDSIGWGGSGGDGRDQRASGAPPATLTPLLLTQHAMEPITHFLTGACIGRAGFNRKTACATIVATLAAEAADLDILWGLRGPVANLQHHRGITHTLIGACLFVAAASLMGVNVALPPLAQATPRCAGSMPRRYAAGARRATAPAAAAGPMAVGLHRCFHLGDQPHPARLDQQLRRAPVLPFQLRAGMRAASSSSPNRRSGRPCLLARADRSWPLRFGRARDGRSKRTPFRGRGWAIFALSGMFLIWCLRYAGTRAGRWKHGAQQSHHARTRWSGLPRNRIPWNPFRWHVIVETQNWLPVCRSEHAQRGYRQRSRRPTSCVKLPDTAGSGGSQAERCIGQVYLDWGRWAVD